MIDLRRFTALGLEQFSTWITKSEEDGILTELISGELTTERFYDIQIDPLRKFSSRLELGQYLVDLFSGINFYELMSAKNDGLWAWISAIYFKQLTEKGIRREEHYLVTRKGSAGSLAYRHSIRTSYELVKIHGEDAIICLNKPMHTFGDLTEQLASRQNLAHNKGFFQTAHELYVKEGKIKPGAASKPKKPKDRKPGDRAGLGSVRRLAEALQRLHLTYDTEAMTSTQLLKILPKEFKKWIPA